ncbi:MAG: tryptophan--tRNA ligase [Mycoplasmoidaceae bacterium]
MQKIISGIQPTNSLTLGNYIGGIKSLINLQYDNNLILFIADLHSITNEFNPNDVQKNKIDLAKIYIASGMDPEKIIIFNQSEIYEHAELAWILLCHTNLGQLKRMTQFKEKSEKKEKNGTTRIMTGILLYPVLMASDILLYSPDIVFVGNDQNQHIELTRDIAESFNCKYKSEIFKVPNFMSPKIGGRIMDLQNPLIKMSKSNKNTDGTIFILDDINITRKKIMKSKTDSDNKIYYDLINKPAISNLISIYSALKGIEIKEVEEIFKNSTYKFFKENVANITCELIENIQKKFYSVNVKELKFILKENAKIVSKIAKAKLDEVKRIVGLKDE